MNIDNKTMSCLIHDHCIPSVHRKLALQGGGGGGGGGILGKGRKETNRIAWRAKITAVDVKIYETQGKDAKMYM